MSDDKRPPNNDRDAQTAPRVVVRRGAPPPTREPDSPYAGLASGGDQPAEWPVDETVVNTERSRIPPFMTGLLMGVALSAFSIGSFLLLRDDSADTAPVPVAVAPTETTGLPASTVTTIRLETTTVPTVAVTVPLIEAIGDPIAADELQLASNGIGPIAVGDDGSQAIGRLVATFGQPNADTATTISNGEFGSCPGDPVRIVQWGPLEVTITTPDDAPVFSAYRIDLGLGNLDSPAAEIKTVSGLVAGDSVETLESIYAGFNIEYVVEGDSGLVFELRNSDGTLLLWGPVTSAEADGKVGGIYSPGPCPP